MKGSFGGKGKPFASTAATYKNISISQRLQSEVNGKKNQLLQDGMVLMKQYLSKAEQISIYKTIFQIGFPNKHKATETTNYKVYGGFYHPYAIPDKTAHLNLQMCCLGKHWNPLTRVYEDTRSDWDNLSVPPIPVADGTTDNLQQLVIRAMKDCREITLSVPSMIPTVCVCNLYNDTGKLGYHRDKDESEESLKARKPVVSFSIGDSADFKYKDLQKKEKVLVLESGDVLIFGGASRMVSHGIGKIHPNTAPSWFNEKFGRLNLTFRFLLNRDILTHSLKRVLTLRTSEMVY